MTTDLKETNIDLKTYEWPDGLQERIDSPHLHILDWGPSGVGKTMTLGTMPGPVGIIDTDGGLLTLRNAGMHEAVAYIADRIKRGEIIWKTVRPPKEENESNFGKLMEAFELFAELAQAKKIRTFGIDSLTTMSMIISRHVVLATSGGARKTKSFGDWESIKNIQMELLQQVFDWPCHVFVAAHETMKSDDLSGAVYILPNTVGDLRHTLPISFDESWHAGMYTKDDGTAVYTISPIMDAEGVKGVKSRLGIKGRLPTNDFREIMEYYKEQGGELYEQIMESY